MDDNFLSGKTVLVMGLGRFGGGVDAVKFAAGKGANVVVSDLAEADELAGSLALLSEHPNIEYHLGCHREDDFKNADIVIANPAVSLQNRFLKIAEKNNRTITSQVGIFFELCPAKIIAITGSNGKSTTAALPAHLLRGANRTDYGKVWLSGNIGHEPLLTLLDQIEAHDLIVLELSSFQIEQLAAEKKGPHVALLTNLLPNHLDRYGTFEKYCQAKELLFAHQKPEQNEPAVSIFNREDNIAVKWYDRYTKLPGRRCLTYGADDVKEAVRRKFTLPGRCNLSNLAGAMTIAGLFGVGQSAVINCVGDFQAMPHRLQLVAEHNGIRWFNDSKATTPEAAIAALEAFDKPACPERSRRIVLIAGGHDKKLPFDRLAATVVERARAVVLIGAAAEKIKAAIENVPCRENFAVEICESLDDAVGTANRMARKDDVVLLSPACASYDMFDNYEQRGDEFVRLVRRFAR